MVKPYLLLVTSLIVNTAMAVGCAGGFVDRASTSPAETYQHLSDQAVLYRQEAVDLRAAARYYEGELNALPRRRVRTRNGRDAIETFPNKLRCRPLRPTGMPKSSSSSCCDELSHVADRISVRHLLHRASVSTASRLPSAVGTIRMSQPPVARDALGLESHNSDSGVAESL